jgi:ferredoxin
MSGLRVDPDLCEGSQLCVGTYPALFEMAGQVAVVRDPAAVSSLSEAKLDEIIYLCPASAIHRFMRAAEGSTCD